MTVRRPLSPARRDVSVEASTYAQQGVSLEDRPELYVPCTWLLQYTLLYMLCFHLHVCLNSRAHPIVALHMAPMWPSFCTLPYKQQPPLPPKKNWALNMAPIWPCFCTLPHKEGDPETLQWRSEQVMQFFSTSFFDKRRAPFERINVCTAVVIIDGSEGTWGGQ